MTRKSDRSVNVNEVSLRPATVADLDAINAIYNYYVHRSTCTYQTEDETAAERRTWFDHHGPRHPVVVALMDGEVVGWGSLSAFRARAAYRHTVENSVYVRQDVLRRGIGGVILKDLIRRAREIGYHTVIASIDGEQTGSIAIHAKHGFVEVAHMKEVGFKFDRWLDVFYMQLMLE
jgi:L-amino acid N-acyltransferase